MTVNELRSIMYNKRRIMNEQFYKSAFEEVDCMPKNAERALLLDVCARLDYTLDRINQYNRLPFGNVYLEIFSK